MCYQYKLFEELCYRCNEFIADHTGLCDVCQSDDAEAMYFFCEKYNFKDYSDAVLKIGRKKVDEMYDREYNIKQP